MPNIAELTAGHEFPPAQTTRSGRRTWPSTWKPSATRTRSIVTDGYVPPTALVAYALGELFRIIDLPAGAIHSAQELSLSRPVASSEEVVFRIRLTRNATMRGMRFLSVEFTGEDAEARKVIEGRSVVVVPPEGGETDRRMRCGEALPQVVRSVEQEKIALYATGRGRPQSAAP